MDKLRVAVIGSRGFNDYADMKSTMDLFVGIHEERSICIVSGGARGADSLAEKYARENDIEFELYPADWKSFGKIAGFIRNKKMVAEVDSVVAFWDGQSKGTKHALDEAKRKEIPGYIVGFNGYVPGQEKPSRPTLF